MNSPRRSVIFTLFIGLLNLSPLSASNSWLQFKGDARHSGNAPGVKLTPPLKLAAALPLTDAVYTSPLIHQGQLIVLDGSGMLFSFDADSYQLQWKFQSKGGASNCNNVSSPAISGDYLHFGTTAGIYYVLKLADGSVVKEIDCGEAIFSSPVVANERVYFASLGAKIHALTPAGELLWKWDYVAEEMDFKGDRWNGVDWAKHKEGRVTWRDTFTCSRNIAVYKNNIIVPVGGKTVFLQDQGKSAKLLTVGLVESLAGKEYPATFGQAIGEDGAVYRQWHRRDNYGRVEILRLKPDNQVETSFVPDTATGINMPGLMGFSSVSLRGSDVYRSRPEQGFALTLHQVDQEKARPFDVYPSIAPPILTAEHAVVGGLDGKLYLAPLDHKSKPWAFQTPFGKAITAPVAVTEQSVYFGGEDGFLYVLNKSGSAQLPEKALPLDHIRSPLSGKYAAPEYDWFTNYGDFGNSNHNDHELKAPLKINWIHRYKGTQKHAPVCGGGRLYTHTSEGQIFAVEQSTGRILWRRYWPGVHLSFTSPLYFQGKLLVPQAGIKGSMMRCLDAATGELLWQAPFTGSPSWSRQAPPVVQGNLAIYSSGSGSYATQGTEKAYVQKGKPEPREDNKEVMSWIYTHNNPYYPRDNHPLVWAWDLDSGKLVWKKNFSNYGSGGNDSGLCLMDGKLYYSTFFGYAASKLRRRGLDSPCNGITAQLDPKTGETIWLTRDYSVTAGCTISAKDGRLYVGGYNKPDESTDDRFVFCLDAKDGALVWKSDPVKSAVNVVTIADDFIFSNASGRDGHVFDKKTGKITSRFNKGYACTRFTCSGTYVLGANMDLIDLSKENGLVSTGPAIDSRECVGSSISNGRLFYTSQASGLQVSQIARSE
ncbi:MAG: PQQ-binding-like beta-propeller repeat protein [Verrucomicrobiota bacterium]